MTGKLPVSISKPHRNMGVIGGLLLSIIISLVLLLACSLVLHLTALPER